MKIMYDPYNMGVGDARIEQFYDHHKDSATWVHVGQHEVIHRAQLGLLRGEIETLTLRVFDHENEKAEIFEADQYGDFGFDSTGRSWYDHIVDHTMDWTVQRSKLQRAVRQKEIVDEAP